ncbi:putative transcription factor B3-Domain family [Helianthus annuus]|nr:putative transcription factor B3-Domain family [Helianthus annuus]KAJ0576919.1 putative transcription factor B3-Domain family [Helianthus annuus]KAJ0747117.1 putative transcription factor B3-Domain family [Helianthus annuus]
MMNTVPAYPVVIRSAPNRKWFVRIEEIDCELYMTTGWNQIKQEMSITDNHLVVFEMLDIQTFEMSVFSCDLAVLCYPPELCVVVKQEPNHDLIELSDDESANPVADLNVEHNQAAVFGDNNPNVIQNAEGVPATFRVDNHYVSLFYFVY